MNGLFRQAGVFRDATIPALAAQEARRRHRVLGEGWLLVFRLLVSTAGFDCWFRLLLTVLQQKIAAKAG
jgi:hypothetical protein